MKRLKKLVLLLLALLLLGLPACAPSSAMVATLTMLPGTPTPTRAIRLPTRTIRPTNTQAPAGQGLGTATPVPPKNCPAGVFDSSLPGDPSQLPGRSYDLQNLPEGLQLLASGPLPGIGELDGNETEWVEVRWQGRSLYWIQQVICRDMSGTPHWQIVDALALPRLDPRSGEALTRMCFFGTRRLPNVLAFGMYEPDQPAVLLEDGSRGWPVQVQSAWEMNGQFSALETGGLTCYFSQE